MKRLFVQLLSLTFLLSILSACGGQTDAVDSGTYEGVVQKVEPEKTEIYVKTEDGKTLELYFTDETKLTQAGDEVDFSMLKKGQKVEVKVEKVGKRLDPLTVKILE
jgi:Cu/Ag efflux protein CusF